MTKQKTILSIKGLSLRTHARTKYIWYEYKYFHSFFKDTSNVKSNGTIPRVMYHFEPQLYKCIYVCSYQCNLMLNHERHILCGINSWWQIGCLNLASILQYLFSYLSSVICLYPPISYDTSHPTHIEARSGIIHVMQILWLH